MDDQMLNTAAVTVRIYDESTQEVYEFVGATEAEVDRLIQRWDDGDESVPVKISPFPSGANPVDDMDLFSS